MKMNFPRNWLSIAGPALLIAVAVLVARSMQSSSPPSREEIRAKHQLRREAVDSPFSTAVPISKTSSSKPQVESQDEQLQDELWEQYMDEVVKGIANELTSPEADFGHAQGEPPESESRSDDADSTQMWKDFGRDEYQVRALGNGEFEVKGPDGRIHHIGKDEVLTFYNGELNVMKNGVPVERSVYLLQQNGISMEIDMETAEFLRTEYERLGQAVENAPNQSIRNQYQAELDALYKEFGAVGYQGTTVRATRGE